tara:strand:+ start:826 stop:1128 length:303 start_codon:yes stop_codon:yes gene_type:complete
MDKHQKYINYIVDDLFKKTEVDVYRELIYFPYSELPYHFSPHPSSIPSSELPSLLSSFPRFVLHVASRYGVALKEVNLIWGMFKEKIGEQIDFLILAHDE